MIFGVENVVVNLGLDFLVYEQQVDVLTVRVVELVLGCPHVLDTGLEARELPQQVGLAEHELVEAYLDQLSNSRPQLQVLFDGAVIGVEGGDLAVDHVDGVLPLEH